MSGRARGRFGGREVVERKVWRDVGWGGWERCWMGVLGAFHKIKVISYRIGYTKIPLTLLRIASGGVLEVD